jgi:hypothetical protein
MIDPIRKANTRRPGIEADENGDPVGKDPCQIDQAELRAAGHVRMPVLRTIRAKCLDCCCGSPSDVRACIITSYALWRYRIGSNSWRAKKTLSPERAANGLLPENHHNQKGFLTTDCCPWRSPISAAAP